MDTTDVNVTKMFVILISTLHIRRIEIERDSYHNGRYLASNLVKENQDAMQNAMSGINCSKISWFYFVFFFHVFHSTFFKQSTSEKNPKLCNHPR